MYPSINFPSYGTFIKTIEENLIFSGWNVKKIVMLKEKNKAKKLFSYLCFGIHSYFSILFSEEKIVYVHYLTHSAIPLLLMPKPKHLVVNIHGADLLAHTSIQKKLLFVTKHAVKKADLVIVPSVVFQERLIQHYQTPKEKIYISPSGGVKLPTQIISKTFEPQKEITFGFVGRIVKEKGWKTIFQAVDLLDFRSISKMKLVFVGTGKEDNLLKEISKNFEKKYPNLSIEILGEVKHEMINSIFQRFDFFIFPSESESESLGLVGLEAMANGIPVIGSDIGGISTYIKNEENGFLFSPRDSKKLAQIIKKTFLMLDNDYQYFSENACLSAKMVSNERVGEELSLKFEKLRSEK
jgi:glycosyltransferase involved in cell wall biosynthesis